MFTVDKAEIGLHIADFIKESFDYEDGEIPLYPPRLLLLQINIQGRCPLSVYLDLFKARKSGVIS